MGWISKNLLTLSIAIAKRPVNRYGVNYLFEWIMMGAIFNFAFTILVSPNTIELTPFRLLDPIILYINIAIVIITRPSALILNGRIPPVGAVIRLTSSAFAAMLWVQLTISLIFYDISNNLFSIGGLYSWLAIGEFISLYRAASDVRTN